MAAATVTTTEYGYSVTGGTDATKITSGRLWVTGLAFVGDDDDDTITLTTSVAGNNTTVSVYKYKANGNDDDARYVSFGEKGVPMTDLTVTLDDTGSFLYVFVR